ncbi:MAG: glutathione S-transferase family protein [Rhodospirillales bacterium]|nr:glutathione S-transferase family protein [Rhodospirillales bacterium]
MLELYHHGSSACATKARLTLDEKGVPWESRYIDILKSEQFTAEYARLNPKCVVPTLVHDGHVVRESTVICEYVDEVFDGPSLVPDDPLMRAEMRLWTKMVDEDLHPATQVVTFAASHRVGALKKTKEEFDFYINSIPDPVRRARKRSAIVDGWKSPEATNALLTFNKAIKWMEDSLGKWTWLAGDGYSLADIAMTIYLNRLHILSMSPMWEGKFPKVSAFWETVSARPSFQPAIYDWLPGELENEMRANGAQSWPEAEALLAELEREKAA